ncbi:MAG: hypothetical protein K2G12_03480 [Prevotella sp.]|nr:hypothetical protein [Prevotella sp.]
MIERKNIIKLLIDRSNVYHSALLTTYSFDPIFFESVYLSTLRKLGVTNIVVLMDASMYDQLLADTNYQCHRVTQKNYTLVRQENTYSGVFHPKMVLLFGEEEGALVLGSGNLTYSGLSNNEEVWSVFHLAGSESIHYPLLHKAWKYLRDVTSPVSPLVLRQLDWMQDQSPWLHKDSTDQTVILQSGEEGQLLYNSSNSTILNSVYLSIGEREIEEITVISPFYDTEGHALKELQRHFSPKMMKCVLDLDCQSAPYSLLQDDTTIIYYKSTSSNPLHAKIIEIQCKDETWILCGSANAGSMALGTTQSAFNDEACIFLHSKNRRDYIKELGISFASLTSDEKKSIACPKQEKTKESPILVNLISCEEKENELFLRFNKSGIEGKLTLLDNAQNVICSFDVITKEDTIITLGNIEEEALHIAVLKNNDAEISNRIIVIREVDVERGNPDPQRRKLSSLLDDADLLEDLGHILGYIEFDETDKKVKSATFNKSSKEDAENDTIVTRDRFNELKDSALSISMHSGVRILAYLQQILFQKDGDAQSDDELLDFEEEGNDKDVPNDNGRNIYLSDANDASRMQLDVVNFMKKMQNFLLEKTKDRSIYGEINPVVNRPKLMAVPGLNAASSLAIASRAIVCMMNTYTPYITKIKVIKEFLIKNAGVFISLYGNMLPSDDSIRSRKILEILNDATVDLLTALCFFSFSKENSSMPQLVLNCLEMWSGRNEVYDIIPLFEGQIQKLNSTFLNDRTINQIRLIANAYLSQETPIEEFSTFYPLVYQLRKGYGFLVVDNIQHTDKGWRYSYHSPWFDDKIDNITSSKYKGYYEFQG